MRRRFVVFGVIAMCGGLQACAPQLTEADYQRIKVFGPNNYAERMAYNEHSGYNAWARADEQMRQDCKAINNIDAHYACLQAWMDHSKSMPRFPGPSAAFAGEPGSTDRVMDAAQAGEERDIIHSITNHAGGL